MRGTQRATAGSRVGVVSLRGLQALKLHVAAVQAPLVVLLQHHGADQPGDRRIVEPRRAARCWVALGIGVYAAIALAVELAVRDRPLGLLLPALHVAGIGTVALALALLVARRSLDAVLGLALGPTFSCAV